VYESTGESPTYQYYFSAEESAEESGVIASRSSYQSSILVPADWDATRDEIDPGLEGLEVSGATAVLPARRVRRSGPLGAALPAPPATLAETGLDVVALQELALKHVAAAGLLTGGELAQRLRLPVNGALDELVQVLRRDGYLELAGGGTAVLGLTGLRLRATDRGQEQARVALDRSGYVGPAPVSARDFELVLRQHAARTYSVERASVHQALAHLVLAQTTIDRLGAGLENGGPILVYGHAGNGKTSLAASIAWMLSGGTLILYAVEIDGYILRVFDRDIHEPMPLPAGHSAGELDARWVYCQRPFVRAGAELLPSALDLRFNEQQHEYDCPLQLKASGGVLLIDDLGAQRCSTGDLLNRCLEPLANGADSLTTLGGRHIPVPFTTLLVLATSGDPAVLLAEEHLRRLPCKIEVPDPTPEAFRELVLRACADAGVAADAGGLDYLYERCYTRSGRPLRAAHPSELVRMVVASARYFQVPPKLAPHLIDVAADLYFLSALDGG
jgi:hypothetical protein